jgi:hypothetical protein
MNYKDNLSWHKFTPTHKSVTISSFCSTSPTATRTAIPTMTTCRELGLDPAFYLSRERNENEIFPWEVIDCGVSRRHLWHEYQRARAGLLSPRCASGCSRCGICGREEEPG